MFQPHICQFTYFATKDVSVVLWISQRSINFFAYLKHRCFNRFVSTITISFGIYQVVDFYILPRMNQLVFVSIRHMLICIYHSVYVSTIGISYIKLFTCFKHGYIIWFMFQPCVYQLVYHISSCVRVSNMDVSIGLCFNQIIQLIVPPSIRLEFDDNEMPKSYGDLTNLGLISVSPYILCWFMAWLHFNMLLCRWKVILHVLRTVLV